MDAIAITVAKVKREGAFDGPYSGDGGECRCSSKEKEIFVPEVPVQARLVIGSACLK